MGNSEVQNDGTLTAAQLRQVEAERLYGVSAEGKERLAAGDELAEAGVDLAAANAEHSDPPEARESSPA